jgi:poly(A) polymerase
VPAQRTFRVPLELSDAIQRIAGFFDGVGIRAYATGGFVRDILLDRPGRDIDISVDADPLIIAPALAGSLGGTAFILDPDRHHARILAPSIHAQVDLLPLRGAIEEDLRLRDFTINALAVDLAALAADSATPVLDPTGGLRDLDHRSIRAISEQSLIDDPLRLLRGIRLAAQLGFQVSAQTTDIIRQHANLLSSSATERQRDELLLLLGTDRAGQSLRHLDETGLLSALIPELDVTRGVTQPREHHWDVFNHGLESVRALDWLLSDAPPGSATEDRLWTVVQEQLEWLPDAHARWSDEASPGISRLSIVKLAALFHDVGKPETRSVDPDGRIRFFGHSDAGAALVRTALKRLHMPARVTDHVASMVKAHLRPLLIAREGAPSRRAVYRLFRDTGDAAIDTLFLSLADHAATSGPRVTELGWRRHVAVISYILAAASGPSSTPSASRIVTGEDVMTTLGIGAGPLVGELLEAIDEALAAGDVASREEALEFAREYLARNERSS